MYQTIQSCRKTSAGVELLRRLLGHDYSHVLAADWIYDDYLHCRSAECAGFPHRGSGNRWCYQVADSPEGKDSHGYVLYYRLCIPDIDQLLQALRPEPGSDRWRTKPRNRNDGNEYL